MADGAAVAVVGMAAVFPGAPDLETFWQNICDGVDATSEVPAGRWDPVFFDPELPGVDRFACRRGGFVDGQALVDPAALGVAPSALEAAEPDQMLSLALAARALADAGEGAGAAARARTAVIVGRGGYLTPGLARLDQRVRTSEQLVEALRSLLPHLGEAVLAEVRRAFVERLGPDRPGGAIDLVPNLAASRIANRLDLRGPAYTVDAACASSLVALDHAVRELRTSRCDLALAGGVHLCHDVTLWSVFSQLGALSPSQCIRPFDRRADGLLIGEGGAMVVLQRLEDAERAGSHVYAVVRGVGVSSDGRAGSLSRPGADGQVLALERAWAEAGCSPDDVELVEAHGTGTVAGDTAEIETLRRFFGPAPTGRPRAGIGSVKSMIGHAMPAAGAAGLVKAVMAVHAGVLPPTLHCEEPLAALAETRFEPVGASRPWPVPGRRRLAAVEAFGFGGINAHVVLESHDDGQNGRNGRATGSGSERRTTRAASLRHEGAGEPVLLVAAASPEALLSSLADDAVGTERRAGGEPPAPTGSGPVRLAVVAPTPERLALARKVVARGAPWRGRRDVWYSPSGLAAAGGSVALLFPGVEPVFEPRVDDVAAHFGFPAPPAVPPDAAATDLQALGHALVGVARVLDGALRAIGAPRDLMAGQSIGEWCGMIASEMIPSSEVDGFIESIRPGSLEVPGVVFAALGCGAATVTEELRGLEATSISHDNCPHQTIVCGPEEEVGTLLERLRARRVMVQVLPFRSGFHSPLFAPFVEPFRAALARLPLQRGTVPLWSATTCAPYPPDPDAVRALALSHLVERVRFRELVLALYARGARVFLQVGTGGLTGMVADTLQGADVAVMAANTPRRRGMDQLRRVAAALWAEGVDDLDWAALGAPRGAGNHPGAARRATPRGVGRRPLPLSTPLVRLAPLEAAGALAAPPTAGGLSGAGLPAPVRAELDALVAELAGTTTAIEAALHDRRGPSIVAPGAGAAPPPSPPSPPPAVRRRLQLSVDAVPALADHCFYRQPAGWPSMADRFPVVPMTMVVELMVDAARDAVPGWVPVAVEDVAAHRWLAVAPPVEVDVVAVPLEPPGRDGALARRSVRTAIEGYAGARVVLAREYPPAPPPSAAPLRQTEPLPTDATRLYEERWLFHGPAYRGIDVLGPMGPDGIDGTVSVGEAPGAALDNAGQLMGFWLMARERRDRLGLPATIRRLSFYGPRPPAGTRLRSTVRVARVEPDVVEAELELSSGGRVWARAEGWVDRRFDTDEVIWPVLLWPERNHLVEPHPDGDAEVGGWVLARERWRTSPSRELMMRRYLGESERPAYDAHSARGQRLHLLGRIAAKDAARLWGWAEGGGDCHPAEVVVGNDPDGVPWLRAPFGELRVSIAHTPWVGVAMVHPTGAPGIDVERVEKRTDGFAAAAFSPAERSVLVGEREPAAHAEWLTRGWAAKEAAAKAAGTGLRFAPKRLAVTGVAGEVVSVNGLAVATTRVEDLVVAWTVCRDR